MQNVKKMVVRKANINNPFTLGQRDWVSAGLQRNTIMKRISLLLLLSFVALCLHAQDVENAEPQSVAADRPGMATGVGVLPFKTIQ